jgi:hypothetical protein
MNSKAPSLFAGQIIQFLGFLVLLPAVWKLWEYIGRPLPILFWTCITIPIIHQIYVWLAWRLELQTGWTSKTIGFGGYKAIFFAFLISRPLSVLALGYMDAHTLGLPLVFRLVGAAFLAIPALYTMFSVEKYFGFARASGGDHFEPEYRSMPLVKKGIFRYTSNGMYLYGFFIFWAIGVGFDSSAALLVAGFSHISIWTHYYATEKPDMAYLYGGK